MPEILEGDRRPDEARRALGDAAEVEERPRDRLAAEQPCERLHVGTLDGADDARQAGGRSLERALSLRLRVEGVLEVLERQRVVEDRDVAARERRLAAGGRPSATAASRPLRPRP